MCHELSTRERWPRCLPGTVNERENNKRWLCFVVSIRWAASMGSSCSKCCPGLWWPSWWRLVCTVSSPASSTRPSLCRRPWMASPTTRTWRLCSHTSLGTMVCSFVSQTMFLFRCQVLSLARSVNACPSPGGQVTQVVPCELLPSHVSFDSPCWRVMWMSLSSTLLYSGYVRDRVMQRGWISERMYC